MSALFDPAVGPSLEETAYYIWERGGKRPSSGKAEWYEAVQAVLQRSRSRLEVIARESWERRGKPTNDPLPDWQEAERLLIWEEWARSKLRPYIAIQAVKDPQRLSDTVSVEKPKDGRDALATVSVICVLDGSPEHSRWCYWAMSGNCVPPETRIEQRDATFYRVCERLFRLYGARFVDQMPRHNVEGLDRTRRFQDGCLVQFDSADSSRAIQAALALRQRLDEMNEVQNRPWNERLHARTSIGIALGEAALAVRDTLRDEIVVAPTILDRLELREREILFACGIRVGP